MICSINFFINVGADYFYRFCCRIKLSLSILLIFGFLFSDRSFAQEINIDEGKAQNLIVFIIGSFIDNSTTAGTGIIVGNDSDSLYILTANHVVRSRNRALSRLEVEFNFVRGKIAARVLENHDTSLDLAVLAVGLNEIGNADIPLNYQLLGNTSGLKVGDALYSVYDPNESKWISNVSPYLFRELDGNIITFEQSGLTEGFSGGGLFDASYRLVGIITQSSTVAIAQATSIEGALRRLETWRVPVNLKKARKPLSRWLWISGGVVAIGTTTVLLWPDKDPPNGNEFSDVPPRPQ